MYLFIALMFAQPVVDRGFEADRDALYQAGNAWQQCADAQVLKLDWSKSSPSEMAEQAVLSCQAEQRDTRAKAYAFMLHAASSTYAAQKADAVEYEFRHTIIEKTRKAIEGALSDALARVTHAAPTAAAPPRP
jgi:hypothetical protein